MIELKSKKTRIFKEIIYAFVGAIFLSYVFSIFLRDDIALIIGILAFLLFSYFAIVSDNIKVIIDGDDLIFYNGKKKKYHYAISQCSFSSSIEYSSGIDTCTLVVKTPEDEIGEYIDCSMLGEKNYLELLDILGFNDEVVLETTKKEKGEF